MLTQQIEQVNVQDLVPYAQNTRIHSDKQIGQIANSIQTFGFNVPVLIDQNNQLMAGHGRVLAAKKLKLPKIPCIYIDHLSNAQKRAFMIADNKLTENAEWHDEFLKAELSFLNDLELDFDLEVTGFEVPEIDIILNDYNHDDEEIIVCLLYTSPSPRDRG